MRDFNAIDHLPEAYQELSLPAWAAEFLLPRGLQTRGARLGRTPGSSEGPADAWAFHRASLEWAAMTDRIEWQGEAGDSFEAETVSGFEISGWDAQHLAGTFERACGVCKALGIPLEASLALPGDAPRILQVRPAARVAEGFPLGTFAERDQIEPSISLKDALRLAREAGSLEDIRSDLLSLLGEAALDEPLASAHERFLLLWGNGDPASGLALARSTLEDCSALLLESWPDPSSGEAPSARAIQACSSRAPDGELLLSKLLEAGLFPLHKARDTALSDPAAASALLEATLSLSPPLPRSSEFASRGIAFWERAAALALSGGASAPALAALAQRLPAATESARALREEPVPPPRGRVALPAESKARFEAALLACSSALAGPSDLPSRPPRRI